MRRRSVLALMLAAAGAPAVGAAPAASAPLTRTVPRAATLTEGPQGLALPDGSASTRRTRYARLPVPEQVAVVAVVLPAGDTPDSVWVRTTRGGRAGTWTALDLEDADGGSPVGTEPLVVLEADAVEAAVVGGAGEDARLVVHASAVTDADAAASDLAWGAPAILSRAAWRADESLVRGSPAYGQVTGAIVHHTATPNGYSAEQVPAILRSIQAYHVRERGFTDIAYNILVDRFGRAWEGRAGGVHLPVVSDSGVALTNERVTGVCVLGDYEEVEPSAALLETVANVIAWKFRPSRIDPYGQTWGSSPSGGTMTLPTVAGHRDQKATLCPGAYVYARLGQLRDRVRALRDTAPYQRFVDVPLGLAFQPEIGWLADRGVTTGWHDGTYRPWEPISREAMAAFLHRLSGSPAVAAPAVSPFSDVRTSDPFYREITWLAARGITTGWDDGTFRPYAATTRDAMAAYLYRLYGRPPTAPLTEDVFADVPADAPFAAEISWLASTGITTGWADGTFRPTTAVHRDAMAAFMYRAVSRLGEPPAP